MFPFFRPTTLIEIAANAIQPSHSVTPSTNYLFVCLAYFVVPLLPLSSTFQPRRSSDLRTEFVPRLPERHGVISGTVSPLPKLRISNPESELSMRIT